MQEIGLAMVSNKHEFLAFLACLKVSTGSGEGSGIDNGIVCVTVCTGSSKGEAEGIGPLRSSSDSHCQAGEGSFMKQHVLLYVAGISDKDC